MLWFAGNCGRSQKSDCWTARSYCWAARNYCWTARSYCQAARNDSSHWTGKRRTAARSRKLTSGGLKQRRRNCCIQANQDLPVKTYCSQRATVFGKGDQNRLSHDRDADSKFHSEKSPATDCQSKGYNRRNTAQARAGKNSPSSGQGPKRTYRKDGGQRKTYF